MTDSIQHFFIRNKYLVYTSFLLITLIILLLTLLPSSQTGDFQIYQYDKLGHFFLFYFWTLSYGFFRFARKPGRTRILLIFLAGSVFGIALELLQGFLPFGRNPNFLDAVADVAGSFTASGTLVWIKRFYLHPGINKK